MDNTTDTFERIAKDAVASLVAAVFTLKIMGEDDLSLTLSDSADELCTRAIALGAE